MNDAKSIAKVFVAYPLLNVSARLNIRTNVTVFESLGSSYKNLCQQGPKKEKRTQERRKSKIFFPNVSQRVFKFLLTC